MELTQEQAMEVFRKAKPIAKMLNDELRKAGDLSTPVFSLIVANLMIGVAMENKLDVDKVCDDIFNHIRETIKLITSPDNSQTLKN